MYKFLIEILKHKSNIDYHYYHIFWNNVLDINFSQNNFTINYIVYIIDSDFSLFEEFFSKNHEKIFSDIFFERLMLTQENKQKLFQMIFKKLFWMRLNHINFFESDYNNLATFLQKNSLDVNRIYIENSQLNEKFFMELQKLHGFNNLSFINFDNNQIWNAWIWYLMKFLEKNNIDLEYLSLVSCEILNFSIIEKYLLNSTKIRIVDISWNNFLDTENILNFLTKNKTIKEFYFGNIFLEDFFLEKLYNIIKNINTNLFFVRLSLLQEQKSWKEKFMKLWKEKNIFFDINILNKEKIFTTIYFKVWDENVKHVENNYFYILREKNIENDFQKIISEKDVFLSNWINLFLFDLHDYEKIDFLLSNYAFNYIYIENYFISDRDFIYFLKIIEINSTKKYKINLISIEINEFQLEYLIENFPENIFYIEINLNKIEKNREKYIFKMLKNKAFIFENMELYKKFFK